jgi:putative holliday junction resolvase
MERTPATAKPRPIAASRGRILAIDYGQKRLGLAISDALGMTAQPLATLSRTNRANDLRRLRLIARENEVSRIIVGLPLHLDGSESEMALAVKGFAARVAKHLGLPVEFADERLTSWQAAQADSAPARARRTTRKSGAKSSNRDDVAAALILRDYLAGRSRTHSAAHPHGED